MVEPGGDVLEERKNFLEMHSARLTKFIWRFKLTLRSSPHSFLELFLGHCHSGGVDNIMVEIARIAILLQNESARHTRAKCSDFAVFQPDVSIGYQVLM